MEEHAPADALDYPHGTLDRLVELANHSRVELATFDLLAIDAEEATVF
jgi:hypothetical protein